MTTSLFQFAGSEDHEDAEPHFLEACFLCRNPLGFNSDIFMYRGNTPFCSKECRQDQMEFDEAKEKTWKMTNRSLRTSETNKDATPGKASLTGTVAVA